MTYPSPTATLTISLNGILAVYQRQGQASIERAGARSC
jgi:hypothetical protein